MQTTEQVEEPAPMGEASPPPAAFTVVLWIGAFAAVTWGMMVLFRGRGGRTVPPVAGPVTDDPTMDAPRPEEP